MQKRGIMTPSPLAIHKKELLDQLLEEELIELINFIKRIQTPEKISDELNLLFMSKVLLFYCPILSIC
jgi:hypothetical protein